MSTENISLHPGPRSLDYPKQENPIKILENKLGYRTVEEKPKKDELEQVVINMNKMMDPLKTHIKFELHDKLNEYYATIVDNQTNEVVREIPSKKMMDIYAAMTKFIGLVVDEKI